MELCKQTLEDFLRQKLAAKKFAENLYSNNLFSNTNAANQKEILEKLEIFLEITKAINYLHDSESIIHRDIKPQNIFFSFDGNVKVGDFGLATTFYNEKYSERKSSLGSKGTVITCSSSPPTYSNNELNNKSNINDNCIFYHTKNIGTLLYSAPEQLNDNFYDFKSDIYSLGLVLFELLHPFKTQMEKNLKFEQIRKGKIPLNLHSEEPILAKLILSMSEQDPKQRPNTKEVMKVLLKEISIKYFLIMESNASENSELLSLKEIEKKNYFTASSKNLSVSSLNFADNLEISSNFYQNENFVEIELKKASSYETCDYKLNLLRNTLKFIKKTEDFCVVTTKERKNSRIFSVKNLQEIKSRELEKVTSVETDRPEAQSLNLNVEEIQNERLRLLNNEIDANFNKENTNNQNILLGIGYFFEKPYQTKAKKNPGKMKFKNIQLSEKNRIYLKMYENSLLLFHSEKSTQANKVFDLLESQVKIKKNDKNNLTEILLETPFYSSVCIFLENSIENNKIVKKISLIENSLNLISN
jgi:serine/threonine protein kinase